MGLLNAALWFYERAKEDPKLAEEAQARNEKLTGR